MDHRPLHSYLGSDQEIGLLVRGSLQGRSTRLQFQFRRDPPPPPAGRPRACGVPRALPKRGRAFPVAFYKGLSTTLTHPTLFSSSIDLANIPLSISCLESINCALTVGSVARDSAKAAAEQLEAPPLCPFPTIYRCDPYHIKKSPILPQRS